jgi:hypothetical protein
MSDTIAPYTVLQIQKDRDAMLLQSSHSTDIGYKHCLRRFWPHIITTVIIIGLIVVLFLLIREAYN